MTKQDKFFIGYKPQFFFRTEENKQQLREWNKDMELCTEVTPMVHKDEFVRMSIHWLQQFALEKERADKAEQQLNEAMSGMSESYSELSWSYDRMKEREKELKNLLRTIAIAPLFGSAQDELDRVKKYSARLLESLYPLDEEESK